MALSQNRSGLLLWSFVGFLVICGLCGGASRLEEIQQTIVWIVSIGLGAAALLIRPVAPNGEYRSCLLFVGACAALMALQLVPVPFAWWASLPGHRIYADVLTIADVPKGWLPLNITPDLGLAALLSLLPVTVVIIFVARLHPRDHRLILATVCAIAILSALIGLVQVTQGAGGALRFYKITSTDSAVGLFANRNHHALLTALAIPMIAVLLRLYEGGRQATVIFWAGIATIMFLVASLMITGSRAGLVIGFAAVGAAVVLGRMPPPSEAARRGRVGGASARQLAAIIALAGVIAIVVLSRTVTLDRFATNALAEDSRSQTIGPIVRMATDFFPLGSGFGSFSSVYRSYEPDALLSLVYLNQAHNDWLQLLIEGGVPGILLLAVFCLWWIRGSWTVWRRDSLTIPSLLGRLGSTIILLIGAASLVDYPLRTPLLAVLFTTAALWLHAGSRARTLRDGDNRPLPE